MLIHELLAQGLTRSFEYSPPKTPEETTSLKATIAELTRLNPSFVSVTHHRATPDAQRRTYELVSSIQHEGTTAMAHLICVGHTRTQMSDMLTAYAAAGVRNVMALGGDVPSDATLATSDFSHAIELVALAREIGTFSIGVGAHPAGHPQSPDLASDRHYLAQKLAAADFAVTQFFFEASAWRTLVDELGALSVTKPVLPGIMPVTTMTGIGRMAQMGAAVPADLVARLEAANLRGGASAVRAEGIRAAIDMCVELLDDGAPGLHFYTLNRSSSAREIHQALFDDDGYRRPQALR